MQRLFSTFPGGWPGLGLLVLRAAVGGTAVLEGVDCLADRGDSRLVAYCLGLLAVASGVAILVGFLTPVACVLAGLVSGSVAFSWVPAPSVYLFHTTLSTVFLVAITGALALLGPGAFSADARVFGRREIIIPRNSGSLKS